MNVRLQEATENGVDCQCLFLWLWAPIQCWCGSSCAGQAPSFSGPIYHCGSAQNPFQYNSFSFYRAHFVSVIPPYSISRRALSTFAHGGSRFEAFKLIVWTSGGIRNPPFLASDTINIGFNGWIENLWPPLEQKSLNCLYSNTSWN